VAFGKNRVAKCGYIFLFFKKDPGFYANDEMNQIKMWIDKQLQGDTVEELNGIRLR